MKEKKCGRLIFDKDAAALITEGKEVFHLNPGVCFENRKLQAAEAGFWFDGYSTWFTGRNPVVNRTKNFMITVCFAPWSYESGISGLVSNIDRKTKRGYYIGVRNFGIIEVGFFDGEHFIRFESINRHADKYHHNVVTAVFREDAGWCDLYVNGVLSNRRQYRRNRRITDQEGPVFVGRFVDHERYFEDTFQGVFHGLLSAVAWDIRAAEGEAVQRLQQQYRFGVEAERVCEERSHYADDFQRPRYHFSAPGKWMNEPHAPCWYGGCYHLFYQSNPHAPLWDNIQWGHMISADMVHWNDLPPALEAGRETFDRDGCWSGSCCLDHNGVPVIFYTAGDNRRFPNQAIAMARPQDPCDAKLTRWKKHPQLIVEQDAGAGWQGEFRDPFVWQEDGIYYMLVGTGDAHNGGGNAIVYTSPDLTNWEKHGFLVDYDYNSNQETGHIWELPVLLPLKDESGEAGCYILLLCACQLERDIVDTFYWIGNWDREHKKFRKFHDRAQLLDLGNGTFTGPSGMVTPDGRTVVFSIAQGKRGPKEEFASGWAHNGGLPVELYVKNRALQIRPIREIYDLKDKTLISGQGCTVAEINGLLKEVSGSMFYLKLRTRCDYIAVRTIYGKKHVDVFYDRKEHHFGAEGDEKGAFLSRYRDKNDDAAIGEDHIEIEYFLDHSMIEAYLNHLKSISLRNYSESKDRRLEIIADEDAEVDYFELWELKEI